MTKHEYSVEGVRERARKAAASYGREKEASMLFAYANLLEQIEQARCVARVQRGGDGELYAMLLPGSDSKLREGMLLAVAGPPTQAVQAAKVDCTVCGGVDWTDLGVECVQCAEAPTTEPVSQGEDEEQLGRDGVII